jgi:hypothetical protein
MQSGVLSTQQQQQKVDKRSKPAAAELLETLQSSPQQTAPYPPKNTISSSTVPHQKLHNHYD